MHRYSWLFAADGDYIIWEEQMRGGYWTEHTRWLIPGSQLEDQ